MDQVISGILGENTRGRSLLSSAFEMLDKPIEEGYKTLQLPATVGALQKERITAAS